MSSQKIDNFQAIYAEVQRTADKVGACDPQWLKSREPLSFSTVELPVAEQDPAKPDLVLLHGLLGALSNWDAVFPLMGEFSRPVALSLPILSGHRSEVKVKALAAYTEFFVRSRNMAPVTLCGNSLGGHVAMRFCLARPELVDCLILSGTSGLYEHSVDTLPVRPDRKFLREHMGRVFCQPRFITDERIEEIYSIVTKRMNVLNLIHAARSAKRDNLLHVLKEIKVPVLLLWGENDEVTTMQVAEMFHKNLPNAELISIKNCGHAPMIEYPEWFAENVAAFLKKHSRFNKQTAK